MNPFLLWASVSLSVNENNHPTPTFLFALTLARGMVETLGSPGPKGQGRKGRAGRTAAVPSTQPPAQPLYFAGYGPGGVAGAAGKAGYPTGTGKESLPSLPAKRALITQALEPWSQPTVYPGPSEPGEGSWVGAALSTSACCEAPPTPICERVGSLGAGTGGLWRCRGTVFSLSPSPPPRSWSSCSSSGS